MTGLPLPSAVWIAADSAAPEGLVERLFRENDVRGAVGVALNPAFAFRLALAFAEKLSESFPSGGALPITVVVGYDCRPSSLALARAFADGLLQAGVDVVWLGETTTPLCLFVRLDRQHSASAVITGSHNSVDHNGFKLSIGGETLDGAELAALYRRYLRICRDGETIPATTVAGAPSSSPVGGSRADPEAAEDYIAAIAAAVARSRADQPGARASALSAGARSDERSGLVAASSRALSVVVDGGSGSAGPLAVSALRAIGAEVVPLFCEPDGRFPHHHPDPADPRNLAQLAESVRRHGADLGVAFDTDGDRLGVLDEQGRYVFADEVLALLAGPYLARHPGAPIVTEVKASRRLVKTVVDSGGRLEMVAVGRGHVRRRMRETGAEIGGELSGHLFFADHYFGFDDATYAAARFIAWLADEERPLSQLRAELPAGIPTRELRIPCDDAEKWRVVESVGQTLSQRFPEVPTVTIDGWRIEFPDGWGLIRASNTQPALTLRFEGAQESDLDTLLRVFDEALQPHLGTPSATRNRIGRADR